MDRSSTQTDRKHSTITVFICFLIAIIEGIDIQAAGVAASGIKEYFSLDASQLGLFFSIGCLVHWSVDVMQIGLVEKRY